MSERRNAIVKALQRSGVANPTDDDIDTVGGQLDHLIPQGEQLPTDAQADKAVALGNECKKRLAEKMAKRAEEKAKADVDVAKLKAERQQHRDERRAAQAEASKRKGKGKGKGS